MVNSTKKPRAPAKVMARHMMLRCNGTELRDSFAKKWPGQPYLSSRGFGYSLYSVKEPETGPATVTDPEMIRVIL